MRFGFGVDLGGTTVKIAYFREDGTLLDKWEIPTRTEDNGNRILPDIAKSVREYIKNNHIDKLFFVNIYVRASICFYCNLYLII